MGANEESTGGKGRGKLVLGADSFGEPLKAALASHAKGKGLEVVDLGLDKYYTIAEKVAKEVAHSSEATLGQTPQQAKGLLVCGTGMGVSIFANKVPGVYAAVCENEETARNSRSINNSNVLALGGMLTDEEKAKKILDAWLATEFKAPCPASKEEPWNEDIDSFLTNSVEEMGKIGLEEDRTKTMEEAGTGEGKSGASVAASEITKCPICSLAKDRKFEAVDVMPGGSWQILRDDPSGTFAVIRFTGGSIEPAHHHTFGHDVLVKSGRKKVFNLTAGSSVELSAGDYLYTPAGDVHRVVYFEDTEFVIKWDGKADILLDEDHATAREKLKEENVVWPADVLL